MLILKWAHTASSFARLNLVTVQSWVVRAKISRKSSKMSSFLWKTGFSKKFQFLFLFTSFFNFLASGPKMCLRDANKTYNNKSYIFPAIISILIFCNKLAFYKFRIVTKLYFWKKKSNLLISNFMSKMSFFPFLANESLVLSKISYIDSS